jgi:hypothetical protein
MSPLAQLEAFANKVYLVIKNRYFDDLTSDDGKTYLNQLVDWTNMYLDELEAETTADGAPINWRWVRENGYTLATSISSGAASISMPSAVNNLIVEEGRYVQITQGGSVIANFAVASPNQITSLTDRITEDMCAVVGSDLVFSRAFTDAEAGGTVTGDVTTLIPRIAYNSTASTVSNIKALSLVKPQQLLILGVAKNATLPDIVQGGLSPSYVQRYNDLLDGAKARDGFSSISDIVQRDDLSNVSGIY